MKVFKITFLRVVSYFTWPVIALLILAGVFYYVIGNLTFLNDRIFLITGLISVFIFITPMLILFINHYIYFRTKKVEFDEVQDVVNFSDKTKLVKVFKKDITEITEYSNGYARLTWNNIYVWEIKTKEQIFKLTNIIISKPVFDKLFEGKAVSKKFKFYPII
jgi:hypothetical protein